MRNWMIAIVGVSVATTIAVDIMVRNGQDPAYAFGVASFVLLVAETVWIAPHILHRNHRRNDEWTWIVSLLVAGYALALNPIAHELVPGWHWGPPLAILLAVSYYVRGLLAGTLNHTRTHELPISSGATVFCCLLAAVALPRAVVLGEGYGLPLLAGASGLLFGWRSRLKHVLKSSL